MSIRRWSPRSLHGSKRSVPLRGEHRRASGAPSGSVPAGIGPTRAHDQRRTLPKGPSYRLPKARAFYDREARRRDRLRGADGGHLGRGSLDGR